MARPPIWLPVYKFLLLISVAISSIASKPAPTPESRVPEGRDRVGRQQQAKMRESQGPLSVANGFTPNRIAVLSCSPCRRRSRSRIPVCSVISTTRSRESGVAINDDIDFSTGGALKVARHWRVLPRPRGSAVGRKIPENVCGLCEDDR